MNRQGSGLAYNKNEKNYLSSGRLQKLTNKKTGRKNDTSTRISREEEDAGKVILRLSGKKKIMEDKSTTP